MCALRGHVVPAAHVAELGEADAGVGVDVAPGRRFVRCLRCDCWLDVEPPAQPDATRLPPIEALDVPLRDRPLRDLIVLRLIALDRAIHTIFFALAAAAILFVYSNLGVVKHKAAEVLPGVRRAIQATGADPSHNLFTRELEHISHSHGTGLLFVACVALGYMVLEGTEAVGLWFGKRWAEYLTAVATAGFLPLEVYELAERVTVVRLGALVVNIAILVYLVWAKRLFGIRGGAKAVQHEDKTATDLFAPPARPGDRAGVRPGERTA